MSKVKPIRLLHINGEQYNRLLELEPRMTQELADKFDVSTSEIIRRVNAGDMAMVVISFAYRKLNNGKNFLMSEINGSKE